jgi:hypothetical protein
MSNNLEESLLKKEYNISLSMFENAFKDFQKNFVYKKNIIMTIIFLILIANYTYSIIKVPDNNISYFLAAICIFLLIGVWFTPYQTRKKLIKAIKEIEKDNYVFELYENKLAIGTIFEIEDDLEKKENFDTSFLENDVNIDKTIINLKIDNVKIIEKKEYFIIYLIKNMFYVLPKENFSSDEINLIKENFSNNLNSKFIINI